MQVKIDTKEKFHVIKPRESVLSATMTDEMKTMLLQYLKNEVKNVVFDLSCIETMDPAAIEPLLYVRHSFYENNASFVCCCLQEAVATALSDNEATDLLNVVPTVSEAADIVQMEEIERELMDDDITL